ncbi:MAG: hypothetical protein NUV85_03115 [Candidatus Berkelbacteria bacterium]|nr:hypothetical protein [Candidatus Berkelbacteria bacterium]
MLSRWRELFTNHIWRDRLIILVLIVGGLIWLDKINIRSWFFDDSFFGYTYAKNILTGNGFTFNGSHVLGTSAPLPVILYVIFGFIWKLFSGQADIKLVAETISIAAIVLTSVQTYVLLRQLGRSVLAALAAGIFVYVNVLYLMMFGHESLLAILGILVALSLALRGRFIISALVASAAFLCRGESVVILPLLLLLFWRARQNDSVRIKLRELVPIGVAFVAPLAIWFGYSEIAFGQLSSNSMSFKILQSTIANDNFLRGFGDWLKLVMFGSLWGKLTALLAVIALARSTRNSIFLWLTILLLLLPIALYNFIDISFYHWFLFLPVAWLPLAIGFSLDEMFEHFNSGNNQLAPWTNGLAVFIVAAVLLLWGHDRILEQANGQPYPRDVLYQTIGRDLNQVMPNGTSVAYMEIGAIAYYSERPIVDTIGIVSPGVLEALRQNDPFFAFRTFEPDYILYDKAFGWLADPTKWDQFTPNYTYVKTYNDPKYRPIDLYKRK